jgi:hypothetical protein
MTGKSGKHALGNMKKYDRVRVIDTGAVSCRKS